MILRTNKHKHKTKQKKTKQINLVDELYLKTSRLHGEKKKEIGFTSFYLRHISYHDQLNTSDFYVLDISVTSIFTEL